MSLCELKKYFLVITHLARPLAYNKFVFMLIPFFAILAANNIVSSPWFFISLIVPFLLLDAAGYTYNQICDRKTDPLNKNPITRGEISIRRASLFLTVFLLTSIISFLFFYTSVMATLIFAMYAILWFSYSGLGLRFKETIFGVFVASFVLWAAAPLILLIEFNYFSETAISLLFFIFLTYTGQEVLHTLFDYENDAEKNCRTFTVRVGKKKAMIIKHFLILSGYIFILFNSIYAKNLTLEALSVLYGAGYFIILAIQTISYRRNYKLSFLWVSGKWPFLLARLYLLAVTIMFLDLSPLVSILLIVTFLSYQYWKI